MHTTWKHLPNEFDDYVATPKPNGYQSIHTVVLGPEGKAVEVQIRTKQMDEDAELGVAAHWKYKEGSAHGKTSGFDEKINWLRKFYNGKMMWLKVIPCWMSCVAKYLKIEFMLLLQTVMSLIYRVGATPLDFAYYIHSNVGHCCIGAKISGRIVPFTYQLQTGDQVEILTSKTPNPSRDWLNPNLNYIHTSRARAKVQHFFKLLDRDKHLSQGKELLDAELQKQHLSSINLSTVAKHYNLTTVDDLYVAIGSSHIKLLNVIHFIEQKEKADLPEPELDINSIVKRPSEQKNVDANGITVSGVGNLLTHMAKCCQPVPGDDILGFITQGRGISVHRQDCEQLNHLLSQQPERQVEVQWGDKQTQKYQVSLKIIANDRQGLLRDVSTIISNDRISILGMESNSDVMKNSMSMVIKLEVSNGDMLTRLINKVSQIDDVVDVHRV